MGKNTEALAAYNDYIAHYPEDARVYKNLGLVYKRQKNYNMTIVNYEKALKLSPDDTDLKKDLASCYHLQENYENALKYYNDVLAVTPDDYDVKLNKAIVLHAMKKYEDAIAMYNDLLTVKNSDIVQNNLTEAYVAQGHEDLKIHNYSKATDEFLKAISRGTKDSMAYYGLAKAYRACGVNEKATEYYEKAIAMEPEKTLYSSELAEFIAEMNSKTATSVSPETPAAQNTQEIKVEPVKTPAASSETASAGGADSMAKAADGSLPEIVVADNQVNKEADMQKNKDLIALADENYKKKNYDTSILNYKEALKINPSDEVTLLKIGNVYKLKDDEKNAIDFYKKAIFVNPSYADGWFNLGLVYASQKNVAESKKCFERVIKLETDYAYAYYALALAYETENNKEEAVKNYELFLKYNKDPEQVKTVEEKIKSLK